ncbi:AAA family ATPase [Priestia megaterium]|uniref:AAA family ATPase n=1 Tax=Priestia megaterium TaxID=1404 RepID=UPI002E21B4AF|nr:AAA family ATPase [Priestia megaterium]MED5121612.1 AAA family ATPase [Priestia megaterium]
MNFKLKGIELEAFRIYQEKQFFNFLTKSGKIANLVVIYAPNGYGKTSFIEGVEWALTGKINRISKNSILKNTAENEKGIILKNRKSNKEYGTVKLIAENGGFLEKNTKIVGKNGRKTDYADGDLVIQTDIFNNINFADFSTKSILGQDKIDSFLRSLTPRERYDTLTNFWDDENDSELFKSILSMNSESEKQIKLIKQQIKTISNEIQSLVIRPQIISEINNLTSKFNEINLESLKLPQINKSNNKYFINSLIETNSKLEYMKSENENKLIISKYLVENYGSYNLKIEECNNLREDIKEASNILNKFKQREKIASSLDTIVAESSNLYNRYRKLKKLKKQYYAYEEILKEIKNLEDSNRVIIKELSNISNSKYEEEQRLIEFQNTLVNTQKLRENLEISSLKLDSNLEHYNELKNKKVHLNKRLSQIKSLISIRFKTKQEYQKRMLTLESYLNYKIKDLIHLKEDSQQIKLIIDQITDGYKIKVQKEQELVTLEQEYILFGKLNEQLNTIYKVGKKFIEESHVTSCPLCKKEYEDFNALITNVDKDFIEVEKLNEIKERIENIKKELIEEEKKINVAINLLSLEIEHEINTLRERNVENEAKIISYNSLNQRIQSKLNELLDKENNLNSFFKLLNIDIENQDRLYIVNVKSSIKESINKYVASIDEYTQQININNQLQAELNKKIQVRELKTVFNKNRIRELKADEVLKNVNELLESLKVGTNTNEIQNETSSVKQHLRLKLKKRRVILKQLSTLNHELTSRNNQQLTNFHGEKQSLYQEIKDDLTKYKSKLNTFINEDDFTEENLKEVHDNLINKNTKIRTGLTILNKLMGFTKYIESNIASKTKESKKRELEDKLKILERGNKELSSAKAHVTNYIETKISDAFNLDSINSIYQRIDPHPDFNKINIEADLSKDRPELHIYAKSSKEKLPPILYFSAAQVNILSLSIFLAKSLINEPRGLSTIFMDDPISHLDNLNILSFIDLLRTITDDLDRQVIISTHNENFYKLIKRKMDPEYTSSKFMELESLGKIKHS